MLAYTGLLKINDFKTKSGDMVLRKWDAEVDIGDRYWEAIDKLNFNKLVLAKEDLEQYESHGPKDTVTIVVKSSNAIYKTMEYVVRPVLEEYLSGDCRVVTIIWKFEDCLTRTTHTDKSLSGDYILFAVPCKTRDEEAQAHGLWNESLKVILKKLYDRYSTKLSKEEALARLMLPDEE